MNYLTAGECIKITHKDYFDNLTPCIPSEQNKEPLKRSTNYEEIVLGDEDINYNKESNIRYDGLRSQYIFDYNQIDYTPFQLNDFSELQHYSLCNFGGEFPDEIEKGLLNFQKLKNKFSHTKNPEKSIMKAILRDVKQKNKKLSKDNKIIIKKKEPDFTLTF